MARTRKVSSCTRKGQSAARSSLRRWRGADGRGAGSSRGCREAGSRTSMTCRGHAEAGRQRGGATRPRACQGAACLFGAMNVSAGVQRPVPYGARGGAGRRLLNGGMTVVPVGCATPPSYSAASALVISRTTPRLSWPYHARPSSGGARRFQRRVRAGCHDRRVYGSEGRYARRLPEVGSRAPLFALDGVDCVDGVVNCPFVRERADMRICEC